MKQGFTTYWMLDSNANMFSWYFKVLVNLFLSQSVFGSLRRFKKLFRLLSCGGAEIYKLTLPVGNKSRVANLLTYVFVGDHNVPEVQHLIEYGILCLRPEFIGDYILQVSFQEWQYVKTRQLTGLLCHHCVTLTGPSPWPFGLPRQSRGPVRAKRSLSSGHWRKFDGYQVQPVPLSWVTVCPQLPPDADPKHPSGFPMCESPVQDTPRISPCQDWPIQDSHHWT